MRPALVALVVAAIPALARAAPVDAPSKVSAVTVYQGAARVTRTARVHLPAGEVEVRLGGLSTYLSNDTLRVTGKGTARARIEGVTVDTETLAKATDAAYQAAEDTLQRLQDQDRALTDRIAAARARLAFVDAFQKGYAGKSAADLPVRSVDPKSLGRLADFVSTEHQKAAATIRAADGKRRDLAQAIRAAAVEVRKLQSKRGVVSKTAVVTVRVDKPGRFDLEISYLVGGATWTPVWDARLDPVKDKVALSLYGKVTQNTGVDWPQVTLAVSTARPARGLSVPELDPRYVTEYQPPRPLYREHSRYAPSVARSPAPVATADAASDKDEGLAEQKRMATIQVVQAKVTQGLLSASFTSPHATTVAGNGKAQRAMLASWNLDAKVDRRAAPRRDRSAYLVATATNTTGVPLLPGQASVFLAGELVGHSRLGPVADGDDLKLPFGADDRVKIERRVLERKHAESGLFSKDEVMRYHVRTTVTNLYPHAVKVTLLDQVPVSRDQTIKVELLDKSTKPTSEDKDRPGVRLHELTLPAHGKAAVDLWYRVSWPKGLRITGLD